jgi:hypothetical protein
MNNLTPDQLTLASFSPWVKTKFRVGLAPADFVELELEEANAIPNASEANQATKGLRQEAFSLIFHGPDNRFLPQRLYSFEHCRIGRFDMFIVPIAHKQGFIQYQAIFNRLIKPD